MSSFTIEISPKIAPSQKRVNAIEWDAIDVSAASDRFKQYDVHYLVDGRVYGYYPASLLTLLNYLAHELELCERRESHEMTLCGYTVLIIEFDDAGATFSDPVTRGSRAAGGQIGEPMDPEDICGAFRSVVRDVWSIMPRIRRG